MTQARTFFKILDDAAFLFSVVMVLVAIGFGVFWGVSYITTDHRDPIESWGLTAATNSPLQKGEVLYIESSRDKVRDDCTTFASRVAVDTVDGKIHALAPDTWIGGQLGQKTLLLPIDGSEKLPIGNYILRIELIYSCPNIDAFDHDLPVIPFRVVDGPDQVEQLTEQVEGLTRSLQIIEEEISK